MKTLLLVRHAKSSWDNFSLSDFDRPLNDRGKNDAPKMAKRLRKKDVKIDAFVSSPAKRAKKTAEFFIKEYGKDESEIIFISSLYEASVSEFNAAIKTLDDKYKSVAIFSHNPGITQFANKLVAGANIANMPTCSVFAVSSDAESWNEFVKTTREYLFFDYPKKED